MAKSQSFADKSRTKKKEAGINVKVIKSVKSPNGNFKFNEKFVKVDDINKIAEAAK